MKVVKKEESVVSIEVDEDPRRKDRELAQENRKLFDQNGVTAIDVMGSVGSGKTSFLTQVATRLKGKRRIAAIAGDLTTTIDAQRITDAGMETVQVNTGRMCHLDSIIVRRALEQLDLKKLDVLFIENVGNLICPAGFPLGSHKRAVVISVTEGPYMVVKHPYMFLDADVVLLNKVDLAGAMGVDPDALERDAHRLKPSIAVVRTNCLTGEGVDEAIEALGL
jgi:hydrogenase nickel incorporation protein HypB